MAIEPLEPLVIPPTQATPEAQWPDEADAFVTDQYRWTVEFNQQTIPSMNVAVDSVSSGKDEAAQSAQEAAQSAINAQQQVGLAAAQVSLAEDEVSKATSQAVRSEAGATQSEYWAAIAQEGAGVPALAGKAGQFLQVLPDETGVRWSEVKQQEIGDILLTARGQLEGYLESVGSIYLQSQYPELYAEVGLIGGELGVSWSTVSSGLANAAQMVSGAENTVILVPEANTALLRSLDGGATFSPLSISSGSAGAARIATNGSKVWALAYGNSGSTFVRVSLDNGGSWSAPVQVDTNTSGQSVKVFEYNSGTWLLGGHNNRVVRSTDNFSTWNNSGITAITANARALSGDGRGAWMLVGGANAFVSTDDGLNFTDIGSNIGLTSAAGDQAWGAANDNEGTWLITGAGFCIRTIDDRQSWQTFRGSDMPAAGPLLTDKNGAWLNTVAASANSMKLSYSNGQLWRTVGPPSGTSYTVTAQAFTGSEFLILYRIASGNNVIARSIPSYGYDTSTQFRLPNVPAPAGLKAFIKAKEISA